MLSREALTELLDALIWAGDECGMSISASYETYGFTIFDVDGNHIPKNEIDYSFSEPCVKITSSNVVCRCARTDAELRTLIKDIYDDKI